MMRNNDFEAVVNAKAALKSKVIIAPSKSFALLSGDAPPEEDYDETYSPERGQSIHGNRRG